jgi:chromosome segregation ATPase
MLSTQALACMVASAATSPEPEPEGIEMMPLKAPSKAQQSGKRTLQKNEADMKLAEKDIEVNVAKIKSIQQHIEDSMAAYHEEIALMREQILGLENFLDTAARELRKSRDECENLKEEIATAKATISTLKKDAVQKKNVLERRIAEKFEEVSQLKAEKVQLLAEKEQLRAENAQLRAENAQLRVEKSELLEVVAAQEDELNKWKHELHEALWNPEVETKTSARAAQDTERRERRLEQYRKSRAERFSRLSGMTITYTDKDGECVQVQTEQSKIEGSIGNVRMKMKVSV